MVVKKKKGKDRLDKFYHLAKEHGYRSRAAFKLVQLNKKFNFLEKASVVIDLCAAPGSWCQVAAKFMPSSKTIIGVDLDPIKPIPGVVTFVNDITTQACRQEIKKQIKNAKAEVVLHDGAPNVGTAWAHDAYQQAELTLSACRLATEFLSPNGTFVTKVFRSAEYTKLLWVFNQLFTRVTATKPQASRNVSAEIFVVCEGYLAPKKIDPKLLDPKFVLKSVEQGQYAFSVFAKKQSRHRTGYEDDAGPILHKQVSVVEFIKTDDPVRLLSNCNALHFEDEDSKKYLEQKDTTEEIKQCFADLKVLGKRDFKSLLKWRSKMRALDVRNEESSDGEEKKPLSKEQEDEMLLKEMDEHMRVAARLKKKKDKKMKELKEKNRRRMALALDTAEMVQDDDAIFKLSQVNKNLSTNASTDFTVEDSDISEDGEDEQGEGEDEYVSDDEKRRRYEMELEDRMDSMYTKYLVEKRKSKKKALQAMEQEGLDDEEQFGEAEVMDLGSDSEIEQDAASKLVIKDSENVESVRARMWFDNDAFNDVMDDTTDERAEMQKRMAELVAKKQAKEKVNKQPNLSKILNNPKEFEEGSYSDDADDESGSVESDDEGSDEEEMGTPSSSRSPNSHKMEIDSNSADGQKGFGKKKGNVIDFLSDDDQADVPTRKRAKVAKSPHSSEEHKLDTFKMQREQDNEKKIATNGAKRAPVPKDRAILEKYKKLNGIDIEDGSSEDDVDSSFEEVDNSAVARLRESDSEYDTDEKAEIMALAKKLHDPTQRADVIAQSYSKRSYSDYDNLPKWFIDNEKANNRPLVPITRDEFQTFKQQLKAIDSRATHRVAEAQARKKKRMAKAMEKAKAKAGKIIEAEDIPESAKKRELERIFTKAKSKYKPSKTYVVAGGKSRIAHGKGGKGSVSYTRFVDKRMKSEKRAAQTRDKRGKKRKRS